MYNGNMLIHASCVAIDGKGVLLAGKPGCGKSDVALRLIDSGAELVADDQTRLSVNNGVLMAEAPASISGLIELRHVGLLRVPCCAAVPVALYVELADFSEKLERLPDGETVLLLDRPVMRLNLHGHAASTPAKIRAALRFPRITGDIQ